MTIEAVESAWREKVFEHRDLLSITQAVLDYEHTEDSEMEQSACMSGGEVNFFEYVVTEARAYHEVGNDRARVTYVVDVRYTRQEDSDGANHRAVRAALSTVLDLVASELGTGWAGTVDMMEWPSDVPQISERLMGDVPVWSAAFRFKGTRF